MKDVRKSSTLVLCLLLQSAAVQAGHFNVSIAYHIWPDSGLPDETQVIVTSTAIYKGNPGDDADNAYSSETALNDSLGNGLDEWANPDWESGYNSVFGQGIYNGLQVACDLSCGANGNVPNCDPNDNPVQFKGRAFIYVLRVMGTSSIYSAYHDVQETECTFSVGGSVPSLPAKGKVRDLHLRLNGWSAYDVVMTRKGTFTFPIEVRDGEPYEVTVSMQPYDYKKCYADEATGSGVIEHEDVTDVVIQCVDHCRARKSFAYYPGGFEEADAVCYPATLADRGDGTVADEANNLLWSKTVFGDTGNSAQSACGSLNLAGRTDWHLPDVAQLQTLLPPSVCQSALDGCGDGDPDLPGENGIHWSSTHPYLSEYCPAGFGCYNAFWAVATGPGTKFGSHCDEPGCPPRERVYWMSVNKGGWVRCLSDLH